MSTSQHLHYSKKAIFAAHAWNKVMEITRDSFDANRAIQLAFNLGVIARHYDIPREDSYDAMQLLIDGKLSCTQFQAQLRPYMERK